MSSADLLTSAMMLTSVLSVMAVIVLAIVLLSKVADWQERKANPKSADPTTGVPTEIVAVLAAAATETLGRPVVIHRVRLRRDVAHPSWSSAGRIDIMLSHRVGPRR